MFTFDDWMTLQKWNWGICLVLLLLFRKQYQSFFQQFVSRAQSAEGRFVRELLFSFIGIGFVGWPMLLMLLFIILKM